MKNPPHGIRYRIYIADGGTKFYLRDWVVSDDLDNLVFDVDRRYAMLFMKFDIAMKYREKMIIMNYHPHIERV